MRVSGSIEIDEVLSEWSLSPVYSDTTQLNSTQLPVVDPPTARGVSERRDPVEVVCASWVMTQMMQNSHEIREFVWLYDRIDIMESWAEELENTYWTIAAEWVL